MLEVAVKVTEVPAQIVSAVEARVTVGVTGAVTVITLSVLVAVAAVWQVLFAVNTTLIVSLLARVVLV